MRVKKNTSKTANQHNGAHDRRDRLIPHNARHGLLTLITGALLALTCATSAQAGGSGATTDNILGSRSGTGSDGTSTNQYGAAGNGSAIADTPPGVTGDNHNGKGLGGGGNNLDGISGAGGNALDDTGGVVATGGAGSAPGLTISGSSPIDSTVVSTNGGDGEINLSGLGIERRGGGGGGALGLLATGAGSVYTINGDIQGGRGGHGGHSGGGGDGMIKKGGGSVTVNSTIKGGAGGPATSLDSVGRSRGGGGGGAGLIVTDGGTITINAAGIVQGGQGGGGAGGGVGLAAHDGGIVQINGMITGGSGGGSGGGNGSGIIGQNLDITLGSAGSIIGGSNGIGNAITFVGGSNQLSIEGTNASITGSIQFLNSSANLTFQQATDTVLGSQLSGSGTLYKTSNGALTLTGDSSSFTGTTNVNDGSLIVGSGGSGALGGALSIASGARLGGTGTLGATTIAAGGIHAPGNSIGTQKIDNDYINHGTLQIEGSPTATDQLIVTGDVDIAGATLDLVLTPTDKASWMPLNGPFTIIDKQSAGGVTGTFSAINNSLLFLDPTVNYAGGDGNNVLLSLNRNDIAFGQIGNTANQIATGAGIESLPNTHPVWNAIALSTDPNTTRAAFDQLSGEAHASLLSALQSNGAAIRNLPLSHLRANLNAGMLPGAPTAQTDALPLPASAMPRSAALPLWAQVVGNWQRIDGDGNAATLRQSTGGMFVGGDWAVGAGWRLGAAVGHTESDIDVDERGSSAQVGSTSVTLYGGKSIALSSGTLNLLAGSAYTWHDISSTRHINAAGLAQTLKADYNAGTTQVFGELGYEIPMGRVHIEPFAGLAWSQVRSNSFSESGGDAALSASSQHDDQSTSTLGIRAQMPLNLGSASGRLHATVGWRHAFSDEAPQRTLRFTGGQAFTVAGLPIARDAALLELGADVALSRNARLGVSYQGQFGSDNQDHTATVGLRWQF